MKKKLVIYAGLGFGTLRCGGENFTAVASETAYDTKFQDNYDMEGDNKDAYSLSEIFFTTLVDRSGVHIMGQP